MTAEKPVCCSGAVGRTRFAGCYRLGVRKSLGCWYCPVPQSGGPQRVQNVALRHVVVVDGIGTGEGRVSEDEACANRRDKAEVSRAGVGRTDVGRAEVNRFAAGKAGVDMNQESKDWDPGSTGDDRASWVSADWPGAGSARAVVVAMAGFPPMGHWL